MRHAFIHAVVPLAALIFSGTAFAGGTTRVIHRTTGDVSIVYPNGVVVNTATGKQTHVVRISPNTVMDTRTGERQRWSRIGPNTKLSEQTNP